MISSASVSDRDGDPPLSIVLIVRHPDEMPDSVLAALAKQERIGDVETVLVDGRPAVVPPVDGSGLVPDLLRRPGLNMPRLKAEGLAHATGRFVAFLEPKAIPAEGWLSAALVAICRHPDAAIGGSVSAQNGKSAADAAAYLFEYGAFNPAHLTSGATGDLPGNNMLLPREVLARTCNDILSSEGLNKPFCQNRLRDNGVKIVSVPELEVRMTTNHRTGALLASRFRYARCFGGTRAALADKGRRLVYRLGAPAVPAILLWRHFRAARNAGAYRPGPAGYAVLAALCLAWALGEGVGAWGGPGKCCDRLY